MIALVITNDGFPLAYEGMDGNTSDRTTLRSFLDQIEKTYGKARRMWVMDRGFPTEEILQEMRDSAREILYLVGTPKGKIQQYEKKWLDLPWQKVRESVAIKLFELEHRADAHILIAFLAYCLQVMLKQRLWLHAPGLTPTAVLEKLADIKMIDVWIPTVDQRWLLRRYAIALRANARATFRVCLEASFHWTNQLR
jgi:hypothetical protein